MVLVEMKIMNILYQLLLHRTTYFNYIWCYPQRDYITRNICYYYKGVNSTIVQIKERR